MTSNGSLAPGSLEAVEEASRACQCDNTRGLPFSRIYASLIDQRQRDNYDNDIYDPSPIELDDFLPSFRLRKQRKVPRRWNRYFFRGFLKRMLVIMPCLLLMAFGALHILQTVVGRERMFWSFETDEAFPPSWGRLSHESLPPLDKALEAAGTALPIPCHSHNDYWRVQPLLDAIALGCTGVEADVWNFAGNLYVGHSIQSLSRNNTFNRMYIQPLVEILDSRARDLEFLGSATPPRPAVFDKSPNTSLVLLVDLKTSDASTFPLLYEQLQPLRDKGYLTYYDGERRVEGAVTVVATGRVAFKSILEGLSNRDVFLDAPLDKMWQTPRNTPLPGDGRTATMDYGTAMAQDEADFPHIANTEDAGLRFLPPLNSSNSHYASVSFRSATGYVWRGHLSHSQMRVIRGQIKGARMKGLVVRYWDTPAWPISLRNHVWHVLMREGASVLSVDDIRGCALANWQAQQHDWW